MRLSLFRRAQDPQPIADEQTFDGFATEVEAACRRETDAIDKTGLMAIGPYRLKDGATRSASAVEAMSPMAMLDIDQCDLPALQSRIAELGVDAVIHGSPSDNADADQRKVRVYVRLDDEHSPSDAGRVRLAVSELLGVECDPATLDAARIGFVGRLQDTPPREFWRHKGRAMPIADLPEVAWSPASAPAPAPIKAPEGLAQIAGLSAMLTAIGDWTEHEGRKHHLCGALGGLLRKHDWQREHCAELIRQWLPDDEPGVEVEPAVEYACRAWGKLKSEVSGRAVLDAIVGAERGAVIEAAARMPWSSHTQAIAPQEDTLGAPAEEHMGLLTIVDRSKPPPTLHYLVPGLDLAPGKISAIQGYPYTAKTPFALQLAVCIASGRDFVGFPVRQTPVLYLAHEGGVLSQEREARICAGLGLRRQDVPLTYAMADVLSPALLDEIEHTCTVRGIGAIVIDTYTSAIPPDVQSFNDAGFRLWANELSRLGDRLDSLVIALLHERKSASGSLQAVGGHSSLAGALQASIALTRPDPDDANLIGVQCARSARMGFAPFAVRWQDVDCPDAPTGKGLVAVREDMPAKPAKAAKTETPHADKAKRIRAAGERIMRLLRSTPGVYVPEREVHVMAANAAEGKAACHALFDAGLVQRVAGSYALTEEGHAATDKAIAEALGESTGFQRRQA